MFCSNLDKQFFQILFLFLKSQETPSASLCDGVKDSTTNSCSFFCTQFIGKNRSRFRPFRFHTYHRWNLAQSTAYLILWSLNQQFIAVISTSI